MAPCVIFEDEHLLVVNKPAGWNTHAPDPYAGEGIYDWLRQREPRWAALAILHRLDKETSGVMVFGKTPAANRSLTEQFTQHRVRKKYHLLTDRPVPQGEFTVKTALVRVGEKYMSRPPHAGAEIAETKFRRSRGNEAQIKTGSKLESPHAGCYTAVEAEPLTGRTHQIRVHAAESGFPDSRRQTLRWHAGGAGFFARGEDFLYSSDDRRAGNVSYTHRISMPIRAWPCVPH